MTEETRHCSRCDKWKPMSAFRPDPGRAARRVAAYCRPCESAYQREYRALNAERLKARREARHDPSMVFARDLRLKYGITVERYEELLSQQGGGCAVCGESCPSGKRLAVDHDHRCCPGKKSCGKCVRGLLCSRCNPGLGYFQDDPDLLVRAINYLNGEAQTSE